MGCHIAMTTGDMTKGCVLPKSGRPSRASDWASPNSTNTLEAGLARWAFSRSLRISSVISPEPMGMART